jgi:hypothetical protein
MSLFGLVENENVDYMDALLLSSKGHLNVISANELSKLPPNHILIWCNKKGIYCLPTIELIDWLKQQIGNDSAIEICSGNGAIGRALQIPRTDSFIQQSPEIATIYKLIGQLPIAPPEDVQKFEANEAIDHFKPSVVIGSYVTQKFMVGDDQKNIGSSIYGVDELSLLPKVKKYITIGNTTTHGIKRSRNLPHATYRFDWLYTRSVKPEYNEIVVWENLNV